MPMPIPPMPPPHFPINGQLPPPPPPQPLPSSGTPSVTSGVMPASSPPVGVGGTSGQGSGINSTNTQVLPQAITELASSGGRPMFLQSPSWDGCRRGYAFKTGSLGTGYYLDDQVCFLLSVPIF